MSGREEWVQVCGRVRCGAWVAPVLLCFALCLRLKAAPTRFTRVHGRTPTHLPHRTKHPARRGPPNKHDSKPRAEPPQFTTEFELGDTGTKCEEGGVVGYECQPRECGVPECMHA